MPQIEQPKWSVRHKSMFIGLGALFVVAVTIIAILGLDLAKPNEAIAAGGQLPTAPGVPTLGSTGNSDPESLAISQSTSPTTLIESPVTWVKLYFATSDVNTANIQIYNMPYDCSAESNTVYNVVQVSPVGKCGGAGVLDTPNDSVMYDFYNTDTSGQPTTPLFTIDGQTGKDATSGAQIVGAPGSVFRGWSGDIAVPLGGTSILSGSAYYVVLMRVRWGNCPAALNANCQTPLVTAPYGASTRLQAFQVRTAQPQDLLGYWAQNGPTGTGSYPAFGSFTTHYLGTNLDRDIQNIEVDFAPPCTVGAPTTAAIRWKNGDTPWVNGGDTPGHDGNLWAGDATINFDLWGISPAGQRTLVETMPGGSAVQYDAKGIPLAATGTNASGSGAINDIGGFQDYRELNFTAQPGYKYQWIWHDVDTYSGVVGQASVPGAAHNLQMWIPYDSFNYELSCGWSYTNQVDIADGKTNNQVLDMSNPADTTVKFWVDGTNTGSQPGTLAHTTPVCTIGSAPGAPACNSTGPDVTPNGPAPPMGDIDAIIPGNTTLSGQADNVGFGYTIDPTIPNGTQLCFQSQITPISATNAGPGTSNQICYTISNPLRNPSVTGTGADIHAGGGLCGGPQTGGSVIGNGSANDYGQYVVAAQGSIGAFGSNGSNTSSLLTIGKNGQYSSVCREDLYDYAQTNRDPLTMPTIGGGTYDISGWTAPATFINGNATISGTINSKMTIIASGDITIGAPGLTLSGSPQIRSLLPSLGIITQGNIHILPAVTDVDAFLFANNIIDTCYTGGVPTPPTCDNTLNVNGFLMGNNLLLNRLGPLNAQGAQPGETVAMNPVLYLNPPYGFDSGADQTNLQGQGEEPPLF